MSAVDYRRRLSLEGQVVLVVGGTGGIGAEIARGAAALGARVAVGARAVERAATVAETLGGGHLGVRLEVVEPDSITSAIQTLEKHLGPLDAVVNCAGTHIDRPATELSLDEWDAVVDVNLRGAFALSQAAARAMIDGGRGGSITHVTSVRSTLGIRRGYAAYCASKGGLAVLIKQLATEWAPLGIRVNGVAPTFTRTPLVEGYLGDPSFLEPLLARIPLGRVAEPHDVAGVALFLASEAASFITGQNVFVDGGVTATQ